MRVKSANFEAKDVEKYQCKRQCQIIFHAPVQSGEVLSMRQILPWWDYRQSKPHSASPLNH